MRDRLPQQLERRVALIPSGTQSRSLRERAATRGGAMTFDEIVTFTVAQLDQIRGDLSR